MPTAPPVIFTPPGAGAPTVAAPVFEPPPAGKAALTLSGVSTAGVNGLVIYCGLINGKPSWSRDGTQVTGASPTEALNNVLVKWESGAWQVIKHQAYLATKTSAAATPEGLTTWTVGTGSGSPTVAAFTAPTPPAITA